LDAPAGSKTTAAAAAAATAEQLHALFSISSTRPLVSGDYVPLGGHSPKAGADEPSGLSTDDEQVQPQLLSGESSLSLTVTAGGGVHAGFVQAAVMLTA
jgi:hypothetical protein